MAIDWVLKKATKDHGIVWTGGAKLFDLDFADDIAALSDSTQGLQTVMDSISDASARLGLMISRKKMKIMLSGDHQTTPDILVGQDKVDVVDDFTYLGSSINSQGSMDHEISCRIGKASAAFNQLNKIWTSKKFSLQTKLRFNNSNVLST